MINAKTPLQRFLFANSTKSSMRHRRQPRLYDQGFFSLWILARELKKVINENKKEIRTVLDIGSGDMPYAPFFEKSVRYFAVDYYTENPEVKKIDIEKPFQEAPADLVICSEVLEHSFHFNQVIQNIYTHLNPHGVAYITVPFAYEVHGWDYHDYFRYSEETLKRLFSQFSSCEVIATTTYPSTIIQKINNLLYYIPLPYVLKVPFFVLNNIFILLMEFLVRLALKVLRLKKDSFLKKLIFSFPINYICIVKK